LFYGTLPLGLNAQDVLFRSPSSYVRSFISSDSTRLESINHKGYRLYFKSGSYASLNLDALKKELDIAHARNLDVLEIPDYRFGIYLIAVDSEEEMEELMGYHIKGGAAKEHDLVFFVFNPVIRPQFKHEIFHLISHEAWGPTQFRLLDEGGATYTDNYCFYDNPMYTINAYYTKQDELFSFNELIFSFDETARKDDVKAYIQSAGIFKYLYEEYGVEKMKLLWRLGFEDFETIYGFSIETLEEKWVELMRQMPVPADFDASRLNNG
ncbi:MAG: hypothetical protein AAFW89_14785, partial [Bacteroidota bacterium]